LRTSFRADNGARLTFRVDVRTASSCRSWEQERRETREERRLLHTHGWAREACGVGRVNCRQERSSYLDSGCTSTADRRTCLDSWWSTPDRGISMDPARHRNRFRPSNVGRVVTLFSVTLLRGGEGPEASQHPRARDLGARRGQQPTLAGADTR